MRAIAHYLFRPRFSPVEVILIIGMVGALARKQYLVAIVFILTAMMAVLIWRIFEREARDG